MSKVINKKGISLVALVVTIIVLIILTAAVVVTGINSPRNTEYAIRMHNHAAVQDAVTLYIMTSMLDEMDGYDPSYSGAYTVKDVDDIVAELYNIQSKQWTTGAATKLGVNLTQEELQATFVLDSKGVVGWIEEQEPTYEIEKTLSSIAVTGTYKTEYIEGEKFDNTGIVVTATYSDGSTQNVTSSVRYTPTLQTELEITDTVVTIAYDGKKTTVNIIVEEPYYIYNVDDLLTFANIVNGTAEGMEKDTFARTRVMLKDNIDLTNVDWTPIGSSMYDHLPTDPTTKMFEGTFDGENHTIKGLSTGTYLPSSDDVSSTEYSFGLFGYAYGANIRNIKLEQVDITACEKTVDGSTAYGAGVAALVGYYVPKSEKKSVIENCHVLSGNIIASNNMGGLIGYMGVYGKNDIDVTIKSCSNAATITADAREAGGIVGLLNSLDNDDTGVLRINNCTNTGNITVRPGGGTSCAAGIIGRDNSHNTRKNVIISVESCTNSGHVISEGIVNGETHAAGIVSTYYSSGSWTIAKNCTNNGNITILGEASDNFAGGVLSYAQIRTMSGCYNYGTVTTPDTNAIRVTYDCNGADDGLTTIYKDTTVGTEITLSNSELLTRTGYTFNGWNTQADGSGTHYDDGANVAFNDSTILYAQWEINSDTNN